jgi:hypothetical protein
LSQRDNFHLELTAAFLPSPASDSLITFIKAPTLAPMR